MQSRSLALEVPPGFTSLRELRSVRGTQSRTLSSFARNPPARRSRSARTSSRFALGPSALALAF